jgi:hypothetical protein
MVGVFYHRDGHDGFASHMGIGRLRKPCNNPSDRLPPFGSRCVIDFADFDTHTMRLNVGVLMVSEAGVETMEHTRTQRIGARIGQARFEHGWTLEDLSKHTCHAITRSRLANYENGLRRPNIEEAEALAAILGDVSAAWLLTLQR